MREFHSPPGISDFHWIFIGFSDALIPSSKAHSSILGYAGTTPKNLRFPLDFHRKKSLNEIPDFLKLAWTLPRSATQGNLMGLGQGKSELLVAS